MTALIFAGALLMSVSGWADTVVSASSGPWSETATWKKQPPKTGDIVLIRPGHTVLYDISSDAVIRSLHIGGALVFARDRDTKLCVGLIKIQPNADTREEGFDCHATTSPPVEGTPQAVLEVGSAREPIPAEHTAVIRLTYVEGMDPQSCPAIIDCGGRMDIHGAPMPETWVKLGRTNENAYDFDIHLAKQVAGWKKGDRVLITGTRRPFPGHQYGFGQDLNERPQSETVLVGSVRDEDSHTVLKASDYPPANRHEAGPVYAAEVANLSRNVVIESADPKGVRGHTMYHRHSSGSISYAEFRHLGKEGVLGRYPIHFHECGDTMRGSSVVGVSIWDSANRCLTVHGTNYLVVRDCIGYQSIGHSFFLEDGTETRNIFDRNLACRALRGKPLPDQALPFDQNDGAGFWWANSLNSFTRNVAVDCDQHGYRFEVVASEKFNPVRTVLQPDGTQKNVDIRTLPFIRFDDNEAHCMPRFGINLGGFNGLSALGLPDDEKLQDVDGVGPDARHPFVLRNTKLWDCDWAYHSGSPSVLNQRMTIHRVLYGIWRIVAHNQEHEQLQITDVVAASFYHPRPVKYQSLDKLDSLDPVDDFPSVTVITGCHPHDANTWIVQGVCTDNEQVARVLVNGRSATAKRPNFAEWEIALPAGAPLEIAAHAEDEAGNVETLAHRVMLGTPPMTVSR